MDPFAILGVAPDASDADIRQAYLRLARRTHPDVRSGDPEAAEQMRRINGAWTMLSDEATRNALQQRYQPPDSASSTGHFGSEPAPGTHFGSEPVSGTPNATGHAESDFVSATGWTATNWHPSDSFDGNDDQPITSGGLPEWMRLGAPMSFVVGVFGLIFGIMSGIGLLVAFGLVTLVVSGLMFLIAPFVVLATSRSRAADPATPRR